MVDEACLREKADIARMNATVPPLDAIAAVTAADPNPFYASLRAGLPLVFDPVLKLWIASRSEVLFEAFENPALRVRPAAEPVPRAIAGSSAGELFGRLVRMNDGAIHARERPVLQRVLGQVDLAALRAALLQSARGPLADEPLGERLFALPVAAVALWLGFDERELPQVVRWVRDFVACLSPLSDPAQLSRAAEAADRLLQRFELLAAARPAPRGSALDWVQAEAQDGAKSASGAPLSRTLQANLIGLMSQTCEATAGLFGNSLVALARAPALGEHITARRELLPALVAEVARFDPAVHNTRRFVVEPTRVAGIELAPGDALLLVLAAANRDPDLNPAPDRFELQREDRRSLGFGHGPHACPGQALACALAAAGIESLLDGTGDEAQAFDATALARSGWRYRPSVNARIPVFA